MCRAGTRTISLSDNIENSLSELWETLDKLINDINKIRAGYSYLFESEMSYIRIHFKANYYSNSKSITIEDRILNLLRNVNTLIIFTGFDIGINCFKPCGQQLFDDDFNSENTDDIIKWINNMNVNVVLFSYIQVLRIYVVL